MAVQVQVADVGDGRHLLRACWGRAKVQEGKGVSAEGKPLQV